MFGIYLTFGEAFWIVEVSDDWWAQIPPFSGLASKKRKTEKVARYR